MEPGAMTTGGAVTSWMEVRGQFSWDADSVMRWAMSTAVETSRRQRWPGAPTAPAESTGPGSWQGQFLGSAAHLRSQSRCPEGGAATETGTKGGASQMGGARSLQLLAGCTQHSLEGILVVFSHNIDYTAEKAERTEERGVTEKEGAGPPGAGTRVPCTSGEGRLGGCCLLSAPKERSPSDRAGGVALSRFERRKFVPWVFLRGRR